MTEEVLLRRLLAVRRQSEHLCEGLVPEDYGLQAAEFTSPLKWHLAHTTWFFETFVLKPYLAGYEPLQPEFERVFNSYYQSLGQPLVRRQRHLQARPTLDEVYEYRAHVDQALEDALQADRLPEDAKTLLLLGTHHEQQHQELMLTDLKYCWSYSPVPPEMPSSGLAQETTPVALDWLEVPQGLVDIGHSGPGFAFDNETPRHTQYLPGCRVASRLVTNAEYLAFIEDGGYRTPALWLSDGWADVQQQAWESPLYWFKRDGQWWEFTLHGLKPLNLNAPVCHVSAYEANAFAAWAGKRLPTEGEWEALAPKPGPHDGPLMGYWHPRGIGAGWYGAVWQWTSSSYQPYPGFKAAAGAVGEYNGKFMCNQMTLRGSSCVTPGGHARRTYRNFFYPGDRWQFTGIRLATDKE